LVCCPAFWTIGLLLVALGVTLMFVWKQRCEKSYCDVLKELMIAISGVVLPLLSWAGLIPSLAACINKFVTAILTLLAGIIAVTAANCDS
jgi:hypothetical protein